MLEELHGRSSDEEMYDNLRIHQRELQKRIAEQQAQIHQQQIMLEESRLKLQSEQYEKEKEFQKEIEAREQLLAEKEAGFLKRHKRLEENLHSKYRETDELKMILSHELSERESELNKLRQEIEQEKERYREESREQIESKSQSYVNSALSSLESKENSFHRLSKIWSIIGAISIGFGIAFIILSSFYGADKFHNVSTFSWTYFIYVTFRGLIVITMFIALARYAFIYSNSYMHESLKSGERRHAINFGKFYLEVYGADASWNEIKEAFEHWNINNENAFTKKKAQDFDPNLLDKTAEISSRLSSNVRELKKKPSIEGQA